VICNLGVVGSNPTRGSEKAEDVTEHSPLFSYIPVPHPLIY
jgi:hypothetical protein